MKDGQGSRSIPELGAKEGLLETHSTFEMNEGNRRGGRSTHHAIHANSEFGGSRLGKMGTEWRGCRWFGLTAM